MLIFIFSQTKCVQNNSFKKLTYAPLATTEQQQYKQSPYTRMYIDSFKIKTIGAYWLVIFHELRQVLYMLLFSIKPKTLRAYLHFIEK